MPITKTCEVCSKEFKVPPARMHTARACSNTCGNKLRGESNKKRVVLECAHCKKPFESPLCHADRRIYCSLNCKHSAAEYLAKMSKATSGEDNPMWKGGRSTHTEGYELTRATSHPFAVGGYVFTHRLVAEETLRSADSKHVFLVKLGEQVYLKRGIDVHHIDGDKKNNAPSNLLICTPGTHTAIHNGVNTPRPGTYWPANVTQFLKE